MSTIKVTDMTMRQTGKEVSFTLSFKEKIELVKLLDKLGVSVIEVSAITNPKIDRLLIKSIASAVKSATVAVSVGISEADIEVAWGALTEAVSPRLQVTAPVSAVQMEYIAGKKPAAMLETITALVTKCKEKCDDVEVILDDATRADSAFLYDAVRTAIAAGAKTVTLCDDAGAMLPDQFAAFIGDVCENVPELKNVSLGVSCSNLLSMADSCAISAIRAGATEVKCASYPVNRVSLSNLAKIIAAKGDDFDASTTIRTTSMRTILEQVSWMCETDRGTKSPFDTGVQDQNSFELNANESRDSIIAAVAKLGYELSEEDNEKVYEAFKNIASKKETFSAKELDVIVATVALQVPATYQLENYVINNGNTIGATAHIKLKKDNAVLEGFSLGDGPIDAAFLAIEQIVGHHYEMDDFQIRTVTEGREAMGESIVKLRSGGKLVSGRGISTDIIGASISAYVRALNKILYEESVNA